MKQRRLKWITLTACLLSAFIGVAGYLVERTLRQDRLDQDLISAIKRNDAHAVFLFLNEGANPDARVGDTQSIPSAKLTLKFFRRMCGIEPQSPSINPTALLAALQAWWKPDGGSDRPPENIIIVKLLLTKRAGVNCKDMDGLTPLIEAALSGREDVVKLLLDKGADFNAADKYGYTALDYVNGRHQHSYSEPIVRLLKQAGAKE